MSTCFYCSRWDIRPDDKFCGNCGEPAFGLKVINPVLLLSADKKVAKEGTAASKHTYRHDIILTNTGHSLLFVELDFSNAKEQGVWDKIDYPEGLSFLVIKPQTTEHLPVEFTLLPPNSSESSSESAHEQAESHKAATTEKNTSAESTESEEQKSEQTANRNNQSSTDNSASQQPLIDASFKITAWIGQYPLHKAKSQFSKNQRRDAVVMLHGKVQSEPSQPSQSALEHTLWASDVPQGLVKLPTPQAGGAQAFSSPQPRQQNTRSQRNKARITEVDDMSYNLPLFPDSQAPFLALELHNPQNRYLHVQFDDLPHWLTIGTDMPLPCGVKYDDAQQPGTRIQKVILSPNAETIVNESKQAGHTVVLKLYFNTETSAGTDDSLPDVLQHEALKLKCLFKNDLQISEHDFSRENSNWFAPEIELPNLALFRDEFVEVRQVIGEVNARILQHEQTLTAAPHDKALIELGEMAPGSIIEFDLRVTPINREENLQLQSVVTGLQDNSIIHWFDGSDKLQLPVNLGDRLALKCVIDTSKLPAQMYQLPIELHFTHRGVFRFYISFKLVNYETLDGYLAIDFGTRNSSFAVSDNATEKAFLPPAGSSQLIPSVVYFYAIDLLTFGNSAAKLARLFPGGGVRNIKRLLETDEFYVREQLVDVVEIFALLMRWLIINAENLFKKHALNIVLTVPVHFSREQRANMHKTVLAIKPDMQNVFIYDEPVAAAMHYYYAELIHQYSDGIAAHSPTNSAKATNHSAGNHSPNKQSPSNQTASAPEQHNQAEHLLVYDFGGGTLDIAALVIPPDDTPTVLGQQGRPHFGGVDLDGLLANIVFEKLTQLPCYRDLWRPLFSPDSSLLSIEGKGLKSFEHLLECHLSLNDALEQGRIVLNSEENVQVKVAAEWLHNSLGEPLALNADDLAAHSDIIQMNAENELLSFLNVAVNKEEFQALLGDKIDLSLGMIDTLLSQVNLEYRQINYLLLSGQVSKTPFIKERLRDHFTQFNPDITVVTDNTQLYSGEQQIPFNPKHCVALGAARMGKAGFLSQTECGLENNSRSIVSELGGRRRFLFKPGDPWGSEVGIRVPLNHKGEYKLLLQELYDDGQHQPKVISVASIDYRDSSNAHQTVVLRLQIKTFNTFHLYAPENQYSAPEVERE